MVKFWQWRCPGLHEEEDILDLMEGEAVTSTVAFWLVNNLLYHQYIHTHT